MPTISVRTSIAANSVSPNVLAGSPFEFIAARAIINLAITNPAGTPGDITTAFQVGGESIIQGGNVSTRNAFPTFRDDVIAMAGGDAGERLFLTFTNTTIGALNVDTLLEITPI